MNVYYLLNKLSCAQVRCLTKTQDTHKSIERKFSEDLLIKNCRKYLSIAFYEVEMMLAVQSIDQ